MTAVKPTVSVALVLLWLGSLPTEADAHVMLTNNNHYNVDALVNLSDGPYDSQSTLTTGNPQPWWDSPVVDQFYGGTPNSSQISQFDSTVINRVEGTFALSGINLTLTDNPGDPVPHALSLVSGASYGPSPSAVGIANLGGSGFSFIDQFVYAKSLDELEWAVAHNIAHELMHTFGVDHHDTTGQYLDSGTTYWSTLINPDAVFSPAAVSDLLSRNFRVPEGLSWSNGAEMIGGVSDSSTLVAPVPEPSTLVLWGIGGAILAASQGRRKRAA
jgi:hypothetical protein